jgi:hypothetical protein
MGQHRSTSLGQRQRIARHKELIAELKRDNKQDLLPTAREFLRGLERVLAGMIVEHVRARDELAGSTRDRKAWLNVEGVDG